MKSYELDQKCKLLTIEALQFNRQLCIKINNL